MFIGIKLAIAWHQVASALGLEGRPPPHEKCFARYKVAYVKASGNVDNESRRDELDNPDPVLDCEIKALCTLVVTPWGSHGFSTVGGFPANTEHCPARAMRQRFG